LFRKMMTTTKMADNNTTTAAIAGISHWLGCFSTASAVSPPSGVRGVGG
jgi:hypothetical protein